MGEHAVGFVQNVHPVRSFSVSYCVVCVGFLFVHVHAFALSINRINVASCFVGNYLPLDKSNS